jgi:hypothetical protein
MSTIQPLPLTKRVKTGERTVRGCIEYCGLGTAVYTYIVEGAQLCTWYHTYMMYYVLHNIRLVFGILIYLLHTG